MLKYSDDLNTIGGRIAYLFNQTEHYKLTDGNLYNAVREMYNRGILEYTEIARNKGEKKDDYAERIDDKHKLNIRNSYFQITRHLVNEVVPSTDWIIKYSRFFECSTDYILGCVKVPEQVTSGLTTTAINNLLADKEKGIVTNSLLETNGIDFIIQALRSYTQQSNMNNHIASQLTSNLPGVTDNDLEVFNSSLKNGNERIKETEAIECFNKLLADNALNAYLDQQAFFSFKNNLGTAYIAPPIQVKFTK